MVEFDTICRFSYQQHFAYCRQDQYRAMPRKDK